MENRNWIDFEARMQEFTRLCKTSDKVASDPKVQEWIDNITLFCNEQKEKSIKERRSGINIYVASSWKNSSQQTLVQMLVDKGYNVYDFKHPNNIIDDSMKNGFHWSDVDPNYKNLDSEALLKLFEHQKVQNHFYIDFNALDNCDICILLLPCGKSAHIEAGYAVGRGKETIICTNGERTDEIMYLMCGYENIVTSLEDALVRVEAIYG